MTEILVNKDALDDTQNIWEVVGNQVDAFIQAWDDGTGAPPGIGDHLPENSQTCRRLTLIELIKIDMERRWRQDMQPQSVEAYAERFAELRIGNRVPADLIYEELHVRRLAGHQVSPSEYYERFPNQVAELRPLLEIECPARTTSIQHVREPAKLGLDARFEDFELLSKLGHGAFASVFLARQISMQRLVALKVTCEKSAEPQMLARLDHPNVVRVYDLRTLQNRGLRLLYMQYVAGGTLEEALVFRDSRPMGQWDGQMFLRAVDVKLSTRGVPAPVDSAHRKQLSEMTWPQIVCMVGAELAAALDYAHRQGVLHRDIKPANILLTETGSAKLVDFNVSSCSKLDGISPKSHFGGSLVYMPPEQLEAFNPLHEREATALDERADLYALGVVLFEMLVGRRPFDDKLTSGDWSITLGEMTARRRTDMSALVDANIPDNCPTALRDTLVQCLAPDVEQRLNSGHEMETQLRLALDPDAYRLLAEPTAGWRKLVLTMPLVILIVLMIVPNAVAGHFNYVYNRKAIVNRLENAQEIFWMVQLFVNGIAFPVGVMLGISLIWPVRQAIREKSAGAKDITRTSGLRGRCLKLGHYLAVVGIVEWLLAGIVYPLALTFASVPLARPDVPHFFGSLAICGLMAAAYPFFAVTLVVIEVFYPALIRPGSVSLADKPVLAWLARASWYYLAIAVSVPMLSVALLVMLGGAQNRLALGVLSVGGTVIFFLIFVLARRVHGDIATLQRLAEKQH